MSRGKQIGQLETKDVNKRVVLTVCDASREKGSSDNNVDIEAKDQHCAYMICAVRYESYIFFFAR